VKKYLIELDIQVGSTVTSSPRVPRFKSQPGDMFLQKNFINQETVTWNFPVVDIRYLIYQIIERIA